MNRKDLNKKSLQAKAEIAEALRSGLALNSQDIKDICNKHGLKSGSVPLWSNDDRQTLGIDIITLDYKGNVIYFDGSFPAEQKLIMFDQAKVLIDKTKRGRRLSGLLDVLHQRWPLA